MIQLKIRSKEKEIIDLGPNFYTPHEYVQSLKKLFKINQWMGIFKNTVNLLKLYPPTSIVMDVGCGGGLFLLNLSKYYSKMHMIGVDISAEAVALAENELQEWRQQNKETSIVFKVQHQPELEMAANSVDIILLNLVCHHLDDEELIALLIKSHEISRKAIIINDLHRNSIAYLFYKIISPLLFNNRLITHDGLLSIQKSFTRKELKYFLEKACIKNYQIKWHFPFWWSILIRK
ncbi:methyltransferase domain-containing protein [Fluoribacter dumoffii]|uniref:Trans-aconitate methyltransferase n=1 Tax=Fluoribacter dumoffii TaxID=463 RepID=A0A377G9F7_9GAMM|nr:methyltransferase domain-containing protein [Fluoribacter dumoffii]KTC90325.1 methyltransferase [Fluoribacter dumoffii NY 23]MCW8385642.1 methyltransferase domain-containing protein [Fluoribacter dumoffii]MCW8418671.1 methyltransferase domain-containing protein [Fluoribacter dumoffii]MCW8453485.1 methyltransferase domain-containing protein [Fluoribacter dumoffii]MCW8459295.1 methyltransferase domain-containing protein [Fluoribacter dumoffii]